MATASVMTKNTATVLVVSTDAKGRARLRAALSTQRWAVHEADGGAAALLLMERTHRMPRCWMVRCPICIWRISRKKPAPAIRRWT